MILPGFFGSVELPPGINQYNDLASGGLIKFLNNVLNLIVVVAGLFVFFNIILAGFEFLAAGGDAKKVEAAWAKIYNSLLGLLIVGGSFVLAAIFGWLLFKDPTAILSPKIYGPP